MNVVDSLSKPLVFISHDTRDKGIAQNFADLLRDVSGGTIATFCSSSVKNGVRFGGEWFPELESNLRNAECVVALLTPTSLNRPWILYEVGFARALKGESVFGVLLGVTPEELAQGPFSAIQNCLADEDAIVEATVKLAKRHPQASAAPRRCPGACDQFSQIHKTAIRKRVAQKPYR